MAARAPAGAGIDDALAHPGIGEPLPFLKHSTHAYGRPCKAALEAARAQVAAMVGATPEEIVFTSCGTESDNWAIVGAALAARRQRGPEFVPHIVTSAIEHSAVLELLAALSQQGLLSYTAVGVVAEGLVNPEDVAAAITPETVLVSIMHSNNEVGSVQPVAEVAVLARARGVLVHSDAAQSLGKVPVDVGSLGVDLLTIVGHKIGAPKGVAALFIRKGVEIDRLLCGGGQELGRRAGTENVALAVGLGRAASLVKEELEQTRRHMAATRDRLQQLLLEALPHARVNGPAEPACRLPNTLSISIPGVSASRLLATLADRLAVSAGAACHSDGGPAVSAVLVAMGLPQELGVGTLRLSTGRHTTQEDVRRAAELILEAVRA
eukprot:scaffold28.g7572.t1